jgi:threonine dehydrogenase-like Zn-dependent dehydrogenase
MKAIAVIPGTRRSAQVVEARPPGLDEIPGGRGVLVEVLRVGVDGTDREINEAMYGRAPAGEPWLILGHESLGRVAAAGPATWWWPRCAVPARASTTPSACRT